MKNCPRCDKPIGETAVACSCGWKERGRSARKDEPRQFMQCAHMGCNTSADIRLKTPTGLADFCRSHYDDYFERKVNVSCERLGLHTVQQKREWVRKQMRELAFKWKPPYDREPGQDLDEPITATQPQG